MRVDQLGDIILATDTKGKQLGHWTCVKSGTKDYEIGKWEYRQSTTTSKANPQEDKSP